jgi:hypothetical protein
MFTGFAAPARPQAATKRIVIYWVCVSLSFLAAALVGFHGGLQAPTSIPARRGITTVVREGQPRFAASCGKLPLSFEANRGQTDPQVKFLSRGRGSSLFLTGDAAVLELQESGVRRQESEARIQDSGFRIQEGQSRGWESSPIPDWRVPIGGPRRLLPARESLGQLQRTTDHGQRTAGSVLHMKLVGANVKAAVTGAEELPGKSNYFIGNDPKKWRTNVPTYAKVRYENVYAGIDLVYYGNQGGRLEYDFVVAPGADPNQIKLSLEGAEGMRVDAASGDLVLKVGDDEVRFQKPVVYQPAVAAVYDRRRRSQSAATAQLDGTFVLTSKNGVAFRVAGYDPNRALVIDPVLSYSTYLGGSSGDSGSGIAVDAAGNAYVTGYTNSIDFPTVNPIQGKCASCGSVGYPHGHSFVAKLNPAGSALVYSTYLGGSDEDWGAGMAVDAEGNAYVTGGTTSTDFPTVNPFQATNKAAIATGFVAKLNPTGSALVYSTYLGGSSAGGQGIAIGGGEGNGIAVDAAGNAYVTGHTNSIDFPTANPLQATCALLPTGAPGIEDCDTAFVAKLNPAGSALVYSTYLGGSGSDGGTGIAVDAAGNAYVTGETASTDFPTANPLQPSLGGAEDAFVAKLNPAGSALVYSTYLGGNSDDSGSGIAVDGAGNAYVTGSTTSTDFPTANPLQGVCDNCYYKSETAWSGDAFVAKLNPAGNALVYSTYLGGSGNDEGFGIAADGAGNAYVTGSTTSTDFPTANSFQPSYAGGGDAFVAELNSAGSALAYSTYLGGSGGDQGSGIAVDSAGNAYVTGTTASGDFPTANPLQATNKGYVIGYGYVGTAFVAKIIPTVTLSPTSLSFSNQMVGTTSPAQPVTLSNNGNANLTISSIAIAGSVTGDFAVTATGTTCSTSAALAEGTSCTINVTFTPTIVGSESASLSVSDSAAGNPQTVALSGTGVLLPAPNVSPTSLSFNNQLVGTTSTPQPVTVTNTGAEALSISSLTISYGWTQSNNCLPSVAANASCTINVSFQPTAAGSQTGTLTLTDLALDSPQTVSLSGTGVVPVVSLSATSLSFAGQTVSTLSAPQAVTLTNTGNGALTPLTITTTGDFTQTNTCAGSVAPGANCTINVSFQPTAGGLRTGRLTLADNASNSPQTVSLSGTGLAPLVSLSTTSLSFAGQTVSTPSPPQTLTLTNTGAGALTPLTITTSGDFAQTNTCAGSVAAGAGCEISVTFTPTAVGNRTGALTLTDNASNSPQTVSLSGTGLGPTANLSASSLTFASQLVGTASSSQPVTLSNTGAAALAITNIATSANFAQTNNCGSSVAVGGSCTINVTFSPTAGGPLTGTLTITDNSNGAAGSTQSVALSGTGQDFIVVAPFGSPTSTTVAPGQTATYTLSVGGEGGFNQSVSFTCTGAPSEATCTVSPSTLTPGSSAVNITVNVTTTAPSASAPRSRPLPPVPPLSPGLRGLLMLALALTAMAWAMGRRKQLGVSRWRSTLVPLASGLLLALALAGCGGSSVSTPPPNPGTPAGTYTLTVTSTAGSGSSALSHSMTLTLTVS